MRGDSKDVIRGGWGIYTDFGYTNANALFPAADASGKGFGNVFNVNNQAGIRNPDGSFFTVGQPLSNIASQNQAVVVAGQFPLFGQWVDPLLQMPYQMQTNVGWSHELTSNTVCPGRLRQLARTRSQHAAAREPAHSRHDDPPHLGAAADGRSVRIPTPTVRRPATARATTRR